jgi:FkbM family methyltransferase
MKFIDVLKLTPLYDWWKRGCYSQYGEDKVINEVFSGQKKGFCVEVGAFHPKIFSNTYGLYKKGWQGICIDPNPEVGKLFNYVRPRDVFVNCGVANLRSQISDLRHQTAKHLEYFVFEEGATNTFSEKNAEESVKMGRKLVKKIKIPMRSLESILKDNLSEGVEIDLLSVDAEGMDLEVLKSNNWQKYLPKVVVCEELQDSGVIENYLQKIGYRFYKRVGPSLVFILRK